jgi:predicted N-acetyltransferase YhbS
MTRAGPGGPGPIGDRPGDPGTDPDPAGDPVTRLVAVAGSGVVGAVEVRRAGTMGLLAGPVVEEGWRDRLVGTRLAMAACIRARAAGLVRVAAPAAAEPFLVRLGFRRDPGGEAGGDPDQGLVRAL